MTDLQKELAIKGIQRLLTAWRISGNSGQSKQIATEIIAVVARVMGER